MIFISEISWAQMILIEVGAMLQVAALCASIRDSSTNRHLPDSHDEPDEAHHEPFGSSITRKNDPAQSLRHYEENSRADTHEPVKAGNLVKTKKVHFVQSFKSKKPDQRLHISGQW